MSTPVKVSACGTIVRMDFGSGFITMGLCDSAKLWTQAKEIIDLPTLDCANDSEVGRESQSTGSFMQFWDPQDADQAEVNDNFENSIADRSILDVPTQFITPDYTTTGGVKSNVTYEAVCQIQEIDPQEMTPDNHYKRSVNLLRRGAITKTVAAV